MWKILSLKKQRITKIFWFYLSFLGFTLFSLISGGCPPNPLLPRVSIRIFFPENLLTFRVKIRNFDVFAHWCAKAISRNFWRKSWYSCYSLFPAISLFRAIWLKFRMNAQFRTKLVSYWKKIDAEFRAKKFISCTTTQLFKRINCYV